MATRTKGKGRGGARPGSGRKPRAVESLSEARRRKEVALANLRELEEGAKRRTLVLAADVEREWAGILRDVRARILAVPSRVRSQVPELTADGTDVLERELRDALTALADDERGAG
jgi:phage terminase Nu1 subunit (DNA packaging protein)